MGKINVNQSIAHSMDERGLDAYFTPPEALEALMEYEILDNSVWEPSCGAGNLSEVLLNSDRIVYSSDVFDYGYKLQDETKDFFSYDKSPGATQIITNPPFFCWTKYGLHGLSLVDKVILLGKLTILESEERSPILDTGMFKKCYVFKNRLPMMHREGWTGNKNSSSIAFAWYVFDKNYKGAPTIQRIKCKK